MISSLRRFTKSWFFILVFALIAISFVVVGNTDFLGASQGGAVVTAGDRKISPQQFAQDWNRVRTSIQEERGQGVSTEDLVREGVLDGFLESLVQREGAGAWAWRAGIRVGDSLLIQQIRELPAFFNQITGRFDQDSYAAVLAQAGVTADQFERETRDALATQHYGTSLAGGLRAPRAYAALLASNAMQARDARWFFVTQSMVGTADAPTDEQLNAFIQENADQLRRPEFRAVSLVVFTDAPGAPQPAVTDAEIQERFDFRREALSQPETRSFIAVSVADQAGAQRIAQALRGGQRPTEAAQAAGVEPITYSDRARASISDAAVADAAFRLQAGGVSDPIRGNAGWTVIQLSNISPARPVTLADVRGEIVSELQQEAARGRAFERVEAYEAARNGGAEIAAAVQSAGARLIQLPPFTEQGLLPDGQPLNGPPQVVANAYSLQVGGASEVIDAGQGQYFVVVLNAIEPAALPNLAEVREPLAAQWVARENSRRVAAQADRVAARIRGGEALETVAASINAPVVVRTDMRQDQQTSGAVGQGVLRAVFGQAKGQVFSAAAEEGFVIGRVDEVRAPAAAEAGPLAAGVVPRLTQQLAEEMGPAALRAAAAHVKARSYPDRARQALGLRAEGPPAAE